MTRQEFTKLINQLIREMVDAGDQPILDYALRSSEEQKRLFDLKASLCDGYKIQSRHNQGLAVDIYLTENGKVQYAWEFDKAIKWHNRWKELTGADAWLDWDAPHFSSDGK